MNNKVVAQRKHRVGTAAESRCALRTHTRSQFHKQSHAVMQLMCDTQPHLSDGAMDPFANPLRSYCQTAGAFSPIGPFVWSFLLFSVAMVRARRRCEPKIVNWNDGSPAHQSHRMAQKLD